MLHQIKLGKKMEFLGQYCSLFQNIDTVLVFLQSSGKSPEFKDLVKSNNTILHVAFPALVKLFSASKLLI